MAAPSCCFCSRRPAHYRCSSPIDCTRASSRCTRRPYFLFVRIHYNISARVRARTHRTQLESELGGLDKIPLFFVSYSSRCPQSVGVVGVEGLVRCACRAAWQGRRRDENGIDVLVQKSYEELPDAYRSTTSVMRVMALLSIIEATLVAVLLGSLLLASWLLISDFLLSAAAALFDRIFGRARPRGALRLSLIHI